MLRALRSIRTWLIHRDGDAPAATTESSAGLGDEDSYTLFDAASSGMHSLSLDGLEDLPADRDVPPGAFRIRVARSSQSREQAGALVKRRYSSRGYRVATTKAADPNLFTFVAYSSGELMGTVGLRIDSQRGLAADELYRAEVDALRRPGSRICEFTRLAIDANANASSKPVLAGLFHTAYLFAYRIRGYDSAVIEVNPRHVVFYRRALGFEVAGPERLNPRVKAPAVLLAIRFEVIADGLARYAGRPELASSTRLLFPYGFTPEDEAGILQRLRDFSASATGSDT
jgi:hypothetical protein